MQIPHVETFIKHGVYLRNWTPRTVRTYRQGLVALDSVLHDGQPSKASLRSFVIAKHHREPFVAALLSIFPFGVLGLAVGIVLTWGIAQWDPVRGATVLLYNLDEDLHGRPKYIWSQARTNPATMG